MTIGRGAIEVYPFRESAIMQTEKYLYSMLLCQ